MARRVFFSFHYKRDGWRAAQVRNIGKLDADNPLTDNEWEQVERGGDAAIKRWIDGQVFGKSCCVVLVGSQTAGRKWINYEIEQSWEKKKGVVGIRIHALLDRDGKASTAGASPFTQTVNGLYLGSVVQLHDPWGFDSKGVYSNIRDNIERWVEDAIALRARHA